jgi:hypothetical protein
MTRTSILEWVTALRPRYRVAPKHEKTVILSEFCATTGYHRKSAIRLLNRGPSGAAGAKRRGRPATYCAPDFKRCLHILWRASGYVCSKRLAPFMGELLDSLTRHGELSPDSSVREQLLRVSPATIDRLLKPYRPRPLQWPHVPSRTVGNLNQKIGVHTFGTLRELGVGHMEVDLVFHCGLSVEGFHLTTLVGVDVRTGWVECVPVWGKGAQRVRASAEYLRRRLPFPLQGLHSDNGSEFINHNLSLYCEQERIAFTPSRPYHKNDLPRVEQRNGSLVRQLVGYGRFTTHAAQAQLGAVYALLSLHVNFFQPLCKLVSYERRGAKVIKHYDRAQTAFQRLVGSGVLSPQAEAELEDHYRSLNPLALYERLIEEVRKLWRLETVDPVSEQAARLQALKEAAAAK